MLGCLEKDNLENSKKAMVWKLNSVRRTSLDTSSETKVFVSFMTTDKAFDKARDMELSRQLNLN